MELLLLPDELVKRIVAYSAVHKLVCALRSVYEFWDALEVSFSGSHSVIETVRIMPSNIGTRCEKGNVPRRSRIINRQSALDIFTRSTDCK